MRPSILILLSREKIFQFFKGARNFVVRVLVIHGFHSKPDNIIKTGLNIVITGDPKLVAHM